MADAAEDQLTRQLLPGSKSRWGRDMRPGQAYVNEYQHQHVERESRCKHNNALPGPDRLPHRRLMERGLDLWKRLPLRSKISPLCSPLIILGRVFGRSRLDNTVAPLTESCSIATSRFFAATAKRRGAPESWTEDGTASATPQ